MPEIFAPTLAAAQARVAAERPAAYARTRNALDGAVSGLPPCLTHGFVTLTDVPPSFTFHLDRSQEKWEAADHHGFFGGRPVVSVHRPHQAPNPSVRSGR